MTKIIFATGNKDKLREIKEILSDCDVDIRSMTVSYTHLKSICFDDDGRTVEAIGLAEQLDERLNESEMVNALGSNFNSIYYVDTVEVAS